MASRALPEHFEAGAFHPDYGTRRAAGMLHIAPDGVQFQGENGMFQLPLEGLDVSVGGASDRLVFFAHPNFPKVSIFTSDQAVLDHPAFVHNRALGRARDHRAHEGPGGRLQLAGHLEGGLQDRERRVAMRRDRPRPGSSRRTAGRSRRRRGCSRARHHPTVPSGRYPSSVATRTSATAAWLGETHRVALDLDGTLLRDDKTIDDRDVAAIRDGRAASPGFADARAAHALVDAAYRSVAEGAPGSARIV